MFCRYCGQPIQPNEKFCRHCGAQLMEEPQVQQQTQNEEVPASATQPQVESSGGAPMVLSRLARIFSWLALAGAFFVGMVLAIVGMSLDKQGKYRSRNVTSLVLSIVFSILILAILFGSRILNVYNYGY
jgi:uncharacterized membrane protein YvbJ